MDEAVEHLETKELEFQLEHVKKMIKSYRHYAARDRIIFAPLHSKNNVCRYKDLVLWEEALAKRVKQETKSTLL